MRISISKTCLVSVLMSMAIFIAGSSWLNAQITINGGGSYATINSAIAAASNGDYITVPAGTYNEMVVVNKNIELRGANYGIDPNTGVRVAESIIQDGGISITGANTVLVDGFHIYNTNNTDPIMLGSSDVIIRYCIIERFGISAGTPIRAITIQAGTSGPKAIRNNRFTGDLSGGLFSGHKTWNNAIYINQNTGTISIQDNVFRNTRTALSLDDMDNNYGAAMVVSGNQFDNNGTHVSIGGVVAQNGSYTWGTNNFKAPASAIINNANVTSAFRLNLTSSTWNGVLFSSLPLATLFNIELGMYHRGRIQVTPRNGLVYVVPAKQYVYGPLTTIQSAVNYGAPTDEIYIKDGTYSERVSVTKSLSFYGESKLGTIVSGTGLGGVGSGFRLNIAITNVKIKDMTIKNFAGLNPNGDAGIYAVGGNNNLSVENCIIKDNVGGAGIYANGPINTVLIDGNAISGHTGGARGIVIWNGLKENITITNNEVFGNICCGIELQDGTASGVTITGNNVHDNGDNGFGLTGLQGPGVNLVSSNIVSNNGRFGIEIKNPNGSGAVAGAGSIVVSGNVVSRSVAIVDSRDIAGIAVFRRDAYTVNVDVPTGVVVSGNDVSGYRQPSQSEGFGIVLEGLNHTVSGNTVNDNDVGIQRQAGHLPYAGLQAVPPAVNGDQNNLADNYFGRGNSPITCGVTLTANIFGNIVANSVNTRDLGSSIGIVTNVNTGESFCSIQAAINDAQTLNGHMIQVGAGTFNEDVLINKSLTLTGAGCGSTIVSGPIGGGSATMQVAAAGVIIDGFTVTRDGNNPVDWNDANGVLNTAGIAVQSQGFFAEIRNCCITGNRNGVDVNNSNGNNIHDNLIDNNRTGLIFRNQTDNTNLQNNLITNNWTLGVLFLDASGGSNSPVQTAVNSTFNNNNISGNWYGQVVDRQTGGSLPAPGANGKNFECNWYGAATAPTVSNASSTEPGYAAQIPVIFGGAAVPPGGQPDILGAASANIDYSPWLVNGTDNSAATGFQPVPNNCEGGTPKLSTTINGVTVNSNNDGNDDLASFSVCHYTNNIQFNSYTDQNGLSHPQLKVYQTLTTSNVSVPFCNNCWATMAAFTGASGTASLINPAMAGILTMRFKAWIDLDNNGMVDGGEPQGDWIQYTMTINPLPTCSITGAATVCTGSAGIGYTAPSGMSSYAWGISGNGSVTGSLTGTSLSVDAGTNCGQSFTLTLTVTDANGCQSSCTKVVMVEDTQAPVLTVPASISASCDAVPPAPSPGDATATDNCSSIPVVSYLGQTITPSGSGSALVYSGTLSAGNQSYAERLGLTFSASGPFTVSHLGAFDDNQDGLNLPITVGIVRNSDGVTVAGPVTLSGLSDPLDGNFRLKAISPVTLPAGQYIIVALGYGVAERNGNNNVSGPAVAFNSVGGLLTSLSSPYGGSGFGKPNTPYAPANTFHAGTFKVQTGGGCPNNYTIIRTWSAEDACGNSSTATQTITVTDNTPPQVTAGSILACYANQAAAEAAAIAATNATDNCAGTLSFIASTAGSCNAVITVMVIDVCGNQATVTYNTRIDNTPPILTVPANTTASCDAIPVLGTASATDNCGGPVTLNYLGQTLTPSGTQTIYSGTTATGNQQYTDRLGLLFSASSSFTVTHLGAYDDGQNGLNRPITVGIVRDIDGVTVAGPITLSGSGDPLDGYYRMQAISPVNLPVGQYIIVAVGYGAGESNGNSTLGSGSPVGFNNAGGILSTLSSPYGGTGFGKPTISFGTANVFHAGTFKVSFGPSCPNNYIITRTWSATDNCGNQSIASQVISVVDNTPPTVTAGSIAGCYPTETAAVTAAIAATMVSDNCPGTVTKTATVTGSCSAIIIVTGTDECGNSASVTYTTRIDNTPPTLAGVPGDVTVQCDAVPAAASPTASDNCDASPAVTLAETSTQSTDLESCAHYSYTITRVWTATDACGNNSSQTQVITVIDNTAPTFTRPADITILFSGPNTYNASPAVTGNPTAVADNCSGTVTVTYSDGTGPVQCGNNLVITRTWTATDACGNTSSQVQTITVTDNNTQYIIYAEKDVNFDEYHYITGDVGVTAANGKADFKKNSVLDPYRITAKNIHVQLPSAVNNRTYSPATGGPTPTFYPYNGNTAGLSNINVNASGVLNGNWKDVTIKKGITVTVNGNNFGKFKIEEGATVTFTATVINMKELSVEKGKKNSTLTTVLFTNPAAVKVKDKVTIDDDTRVNVGGPIVTFYAGDNTGGDEKFEVKGENSQVTANIMVPVGKLHVHGGNDISRPTIMTGWYIIEKLDGHGKYVYWNKYDCVPAAPRGPVYTGTDKMVTPSLTRNGKFDVKVFPNPSVTDFRVQINSDSDAPVRIRIFDVSGRTLQTISNATANSYLSMGSELRQGSYFVEIQQGTNRQTVKLLKME